MHFSCVTILQNQYLFWFTDCPFYSQYKLSLCIHKSQSAPSRNQPQIHQPKSILSFDCACFQCSLSRFLLGVGNHFLDWLIQIYNNNKMQEKELEKIDSIQYFNAYIHTYTHCIFWNQIVIIGNMLFCYYVISFDIFKILHCRCFPFLQIIIFDCFYFIFKWMVFYSYSMLFYLHQTLILADVSIDRTWCHHFLGIYSKSPGYKRHSCLVGASLKNNG